MHPRSDDDEYEPLQKTSQPSLKTKRIGAAVLAVVCLILIITLSVIFTKKKDSSSSDSFYSIITQQVNYTDSNGTLLIGYMAYASNATSKFPSPGIVVAPYWGGIGPNEKNRTVWLASLGYIALAIDVYGNGMTPTTTTDRQSNVSFLQNNPTIWRDRANAGLNVLINSPLVNASLLGSAGYCFGGSTVMELARSGAPVLASVSFHASKIQGQVMACNGQLDSGTTSSLPGFMNEMNAGNISWGILNHKNAVHCFTDFTAQGANATATCQYNYDADIRSHKAMLDLFHVVFNNQDDIDNSNGLLERYIDYNDSNGDVMEGYLVYKSDLRGEVPGVAVNHWWGGIGDNEILRAQNLARMGYVAFAVDVYGKGIRPETQEDRESNVTFLEENPTIWRDRANKGLEVLQGLQSVNSTQLAAVGYCFGGSTTMELARSGAPILAGVSFHGGVNSSTPNATLIQGQILVCNGALDTSTTPGLPSFIDEMNSNNVTWNILNLDGAYHCFTDHEANSTGCMYNLWADQRSHDAMKALLAEVFVLPRSLETPL